MYTRSQVRQVRVRKYEQDSLKKQLRKVKSMQRQGTEAIRDVTKPFPHYSPMGAVCCHRNQSSDPI